MTRLLISALLIAPVISANVCAGDDFEAPIEIKHAGKAFDLYYPTPILYDIDNDEQPELIVGDLRGYIYVSETEAAIPGADWGAAEKLNAEGETLKLNNW